MTIDMQPERLIGHVAARLAAACFSRQNSLQENGVMPRWYLSIWIGLTVGAMSTFSGHAASATTVTISRDHDGVVCSGWAINSDFVATSAYCVLKPAFYSVSIGDESYVVWRVSLHPEFSTAIGRGYLMNEEFAYSLAILQIVQRDLVVEAQDHVQSKDQLAGASLFTVLAKRPDRPTAKTIEQLPYARLQEANSGFVVSNDEKGYDVCYQDFGAPMLAKVGDSHLIVGIIVNNRSLPGSPKDSCGNELHVVDASVILQFLQSRLKN